MSTLAFSSKETITPPLERVVPIPYSSHAILSTVLISFFLLAIAGYERYFFSILPFPRPFTTGFLILVAPALALIFSVISLRQGIKLRMQMRGMVLAYISFFISTFYFVIILALPLVLLCLYIMYVYIL